MKQDDKRVICVHLKQGIDYFTYVKILMVNKESQRWKNLRTKEKKKKKNMPLTNKTLIGAVFKKNH